MITDIPFFCSFHDLIVLSTTRKSYRRKRKEKEKETESEIEKKKRFFLLPM